MSSGSSTQPPRRRYDASGRQAAARETKTRILQSAQAQFEHQGWSATTMPAVAADAGVSIKTIEARFKTKAALLGSVVDFAIRGDASSVPIIERETVAAMKAASDAGSFLKLHAHLVRVVQERSAGVQAAVENAATTEPAAQELWQQMLRNRHNGTTAPARKLLTLPGLRAGVTLMDATTVFWLTTDWSYWRALHDQLGFSADAIEAWTHTHYRAALLDPDAGPVAPAPARLDQEP